MQHAAMVVVMLGSAPLAVYSQDDAKRADTEAEAAVVEFAQAMAEQDARIDDRVLAIRRVSKVRHKRVLDALDPYLAGGPMLQRVVVARVLGDFAKVNGAGRALCSAYVKEANASSEMIPVRISILRSLGAMKSMEGAPVVDAAIRHGDVWVAKAAADAAGKIRAKSSIEPLIELFAKLSGKEGNQQIDTKDPLADLLSDAKKTSTDPDVHARKFEDARAGAGPADTTLRDILRKPVLDALMSITRCRYSTVSEWKQWWISNRRNFQVPK
jgi:HEAT repeat protein